MATTIDEDKLIAIHDSIQALAGNTERIQNLQEQVSAINNTLGEGSLGINNSYDLVIHNALEFNDLISKYKNGYTDDAGVVHPAGSWYTPVGSEAQCSSGRGGDHFRGYNHSSSCHYSGCKRRCLHNLYCYYWGKCHHTR